MRWLVHDDQIRIRLYGVENFSRNQKREREKHLAVEFSRLIGYLFAQGSWRVAS